MFLNLSPGVRRKQPGERSPCVRSDFRVVGWSTVLWLGAGWLGARGSQASCCTPGRRAVSICTVSWTGGCIPDWWLHSSGCVTCVRPQTDMGDSPAATLCNVLKALNHLAYDYAAGGLRSHPNTRACSIQLS